jgi:hypothetical protein
MVLPQVAALLSKQSTGQSNNLYFFNRLRIVLDKVHGAKAREPADLKQ